MNAFEPLQPHEVPPEPAAAPLPGPPGLPPKNPKLAAFLSIFPGLGHVYNGLYLRGIVFFLLFVSLITITARDHPFAGFGIAFVWLFDLLDAYRQATLINYGYAMDLGLLDRPRAPFARQGGIVAGVLLVLIGLFSLADRYLAINLDWIFDLWPVALILAGAWLIVGAIRDRRRAQGT
jgi:hypothetical protein